MILKQEPQGSCWGDGHYSCDNCKWFRKDIMGDEGKEKRDALLRGKMGIQISFLK